MTPQIEDLTAAEIPLGRRHDAVLATHPAPNGRGPKPADHAAAGHGGSTASRKATEGTVVVATAPAPGPREPIADPRTPASRR